MRGVLSLRVIRFRGISHARLHRTVSKGLVGHLICSITASPNFKGNGVRPVVCVCVCVCVYVCMHDPRMGIGCTVMKKGKIDGLSLMRRLLVQA